MVYRGRVVNGTVVLDEPVELPEGTEVRIEPLASSSRQTLAEEFADVIGKVPDLPTDMAQNHDHYIHGTPKP